MGTVKHFPVRMAWNNYADTPSLITASSEVSTLPVTFLQNQQIGKVFRSLATTGLTIDIDLGSAKGVTQFAIRKHNLIWDGAGDVFMTLTGSTNAAHSPAGATWGISLQNDDLILHDWAGATHTYQYWRVETADDNNTDGYLEFGYIYLGTYDEFDFPNNQTATSKVDPAVKRSNWDGSFVAFNRTKYRRIDFAMSPVQQADRRTLEGIYDEVGIGKGLFVFLDANNNRDIDGKHRMTVFGSFAGQLKVDHMAIDWHGVDSLVFEEIR